MTNRLRLYVVLCLILPLAACGWWRAAPPVETPQPVARQSWYCITNPDWDGWDCGHDPQQVARPLPARPAPVPSPYAALLESYDLDSPVTSPGAVPVAPDHAGVSPPAEPAQETVPTEPAPPLVATDDQSLRAAPGDYFAVQLAAMSSRAGADQYLREHGLDDAHVALIESGGRDYAVVIYGVYPTRAAAVAAADKRPASLRRLQPWIRRVSTLQAAMTRAGV